MAKTFKVERRGRKRKPGPRYPSGDLVSQREVLVARVIAFQQPHRREVPEKLRHDPRAETFFGRLMLNGIISETAYEAGILYRRGVQRYRSHWLDCPTEAPASIAGFMQPTGGSGREVDQSELNRIKEAYDGAVNSLMAAGQKVARAVARVAVWDEWPEGVRQVDLDRGLCVLISHYGLTRR